jgi:zinc/manganese transport system permease protein
MPPVFYDLLIAPFAEFAFMRRALVGTAAIALAGGPVGVFLMLRRMSLTGDAMAHAILPGAAVGYLVAGLSLPAMTLGGFAAGCIVAVLAGLVARATALKEDASLAAFYLLSLALGVTIVSLRGSNVDLLHVLFGTVLALDDAALLLLGGIATLTLVALALLYRPLVLECVDPTFLRSVSRAGTPVHLTFLSLLVLNLVGGFQALGTLLAVGLMMLPAAAARFWSADVSMMIVIATGIGLISSASGLLMSFHAELPAGPAIVLAAGAVYAVSLTFGRAGGLLWLAWPGRHLEA